MEQMNQVGPGPTPSEELVKRLCETAVSSSSWMKFLGVLLIINGVMVACTGFGLLICWLPIWLGVILFRAAGDAEIASKGAAVKLVDFLEKLNRFFLIEGILALIGLVISLIFIFVIGMAGFWGLMSGLAR